jgi:hypothetical protein
MGARSPQAAGRESALVSAHQRQNVVASNSTEQERQVAVPHSWHRVRPIGCSIVMPQSQ